MRTILTWTILLLLAFSALYGACQGSLTGPVSALVFDSGALRPVLGVPGAAYLGAGLIGGLEAAATSPDGKHVACVRDGLLSVLRENGSEWIPAFSANGFTASTLLAWSEDSAELAAVDASGRLHLWTADGKLVASRALPGAAVALAVSASVAVAAVKDGDSGSIVLAGNDRTSVLARADNPAALAIAGDDLYFTDRARGEVWLLRGFAGSRELLLAAKIDDPVAAAVDPARRLLVVASAAGRKAIGLRLESFDPVFNLALEFEPSSLERFGTSGWLLSSGRRGPLQVLVIDEAAAVYFVPREERN